MNIHERVKEIEEKYQAGQNLFRRQSVGVLLERISQLEQSGQHSVQADELKTCAECGALGYSHHPSCSKYGSYVFSTRR